MPHTNGLTPILTMKTRIITDANSMKEKKGLKEI